MSNDTKTPFFRKIDWASFWTASAVSFLVYFLTLGPSVGLEDSGELAVAGDHLGVPHPPGYPIWSIISFLFARVFSFVTYRGQPNPAWAIALGSAVFGALAAGCAAMLITRSASDMLDGARSTVRRDPAPGDGLFCWAGGVAGSLLFAFSPVMWSQSTIVEVYSLGAFFLMLVMLLTYRWMRRPSDKLLWLTAFVFGLGLTNYQVLLLAALPLVVILFLRNIALFRDFILVAIPFGLAAIPLKLGAMPVQPGLRKLLCLDLGVASLPGQYGAPLLRNTAAAMLVRQVDNGLVVAALAVFGLALLFLGVVGALRRRAAARQAALPERPLLLAASAAFGLSLVLMLAAIFHTHQAPLSNPANHVLLDPAKYATVGAGMMAVVALSAIAAVFGGDAWSNPLRWGPLLAACLLFLALAGYIEETVPVLPGAFQTPDPAMKAFDASPYTWGFALGAALLVGLSATTPRGLCFALPVAIVETLYLLLVMKGAALGLTHPSTWWFCGPVVFNFVVLALAAFALPGGRSVAGTFLMGELGVSFYAYMPIVSDLRNPPMNWGYPRTWEGFKHAITRGQYEKIAPTDIFAPHFIQQLGDYFIDLRRQFTLLLAPLGFLPFAAWRLRRGGEGGDRRVDPRLLLAAAALAVLALALWGVDSFVAAEAISDRAAGGLRLLSAAALLLAVGAALWGGMRPIFAASALIAVTVVFVVLGNIPGVERGFDASRIDKLSVAVLLLLCAFGGVWLFFRQMEGAVARMFRERGASETATVGLVAAAGLLFVAGSLYKVLQACLVYGIALHQKIAAGAVAAKWPEVFGTVVKSNQALCTVVPGLLAVLLVAAAAAGLWYLSRRRVVVSSLDDVSQQWIIGTVCNFLVMSILLIMLANPKGDLQDTFIQKVKFISSHGLFALWIGYGLVFALAILDGLLARFAGRGRAALAVAAAVLVLLCAGIPVQQNYCNGQLVFELGGAEQDGHDYGWQFGNYQLRGAEAITEELEADEEPLPNPSYPPAMGEGAVFFGGTDPGRFVPTYMIYSADVRPDVFLITQNALADNTFMSVTRDLYGDQIWIPTPKESESAFSIYVSEVNSGKRPRNADLVVESGRVQVVGALGVMEINGILCKMIFDHNKPGAYREAGRDGKAGHEFYVEESYVIPWMYPYLSPHGLIMHINAETAPLSQRNVEDDMDFWDWYVRRLTRDARFRRDLVAQKSFSKLRSAIAGLYVNRGRFVEGERAYGEARVLYPVSPEATFRAVQDILLRQGRLDEALEVVRHFCRRDPNHDRGPVVRDYIVNAKRRRAELTQLLSAAPPGVAPALPTALRIADLYLQDGLEGAARSLLARCVADSSMNVGDGYTLARLLMEARDPANAARAMNRIWKAKFVQDSPPRLLLAIQVYGAVGDIARLRALMPRYLEMQPGDWRTWLDWAAVLVHDKRYDEAAAALQRGIAAGGEQALVAVEQDVTLRSLAQRLPQARPARSGAVGFPGAAAPMAPAGGR